MVVVGAIGGLGNQFFQYALYKKFICQGKEAYIDLSYFDRESTTEKWRLEGLCADIKYATPAQKRKYAERPGRIAGRMRRIFGPKKSHIFEKGSGTFDAALLEKDNVYLEGYWQTQEYFKDIRPEILSGIVFPEFSCENTAKYAEQIKGTGNSVSLHIRRGDYIKMAHVYGNLAESGYYEKAMSYICEKVESPTFYVFSDDIEWCKKKFENVVSNAKVVYVEDRKSTPPHEDLQLMSMCENHIIANSSYSWWGAWLDDKGAGVVIAPEQWLIGRETPDICPKQWVRM